MASVTFVLKEPSSSKESLIYALLRFNNKRVKISTSEKILPKFWNPEKQRAKESKSFPQYVEFNSYLDTVESSVKNIYRKLVNDLELPTGDKIKSELNILLNKTPIEEKKTFFQFIEELIETSSKRPNTIKNYKQTLVKLKDFQKQTKKPVEFENITLEFYNDFMKYLQEKEYSTNSIGSLVKNVKVFMNEATDRGLNKNMEYLNKRFKVIEENADTIYLTEQELKKVYDFDLCKNERLEKVRDLFIVGCYTGLRFSDLEKLKPENFIKDFSQIKIQTEKTGETVIIPVHRLVKELLMKYDFTLPKAISNQKTNDYLKEIIRKVGIEEKIIVGTTKGGKRVQTTFFKYQLVTTHTARRSFATNLYLADVPSITIMKITGHKTEKAFLKYIRLTQEQNANKLVNHPFFN